HPQRPAVLNIQASAGEDGPVGREGDVRKRGVAREYEVDAAAAIVGRVGGQRAVANRQRAKGVVENAAAGAIETAGGGVTGQGAVQDGQIAKVVVDAAAVGRRVAR